MARGKAINVKIATPKVIKALETKLAELNKSWATQGERVISLLNHRGTLRFYTNTLTMK